MTQAGRPVADNPDDVADQAPITIEADTEVPLASLVRRGWVANTFASFRQRDFSLFWSGALVSNIGSWMQNAALVIVVYGLAPKQASLYAGLVGFISGAPVFFLAIPAGDIADRFDRRKLLILIQVVLLGQATALGLLYNSQILSASRPIFSLSLVAGLGLVAGVFTAFMMPAFQSMLPDLVPRESLMNAIALNAVQFQSSRMFGPMIVSAMVLAGAGMGLVFFANAASFLFVIAALLAIRPRAAFNPEAAAKHRAEETAWQRIGAGIKYARSNRAVGMLILSTAMLTIFGFPYMTLLAAIVAENLGGTVSSGRPSGRGDHGVQRPRRTSRRSRGGEPAGLHAEKPRDPLHAARVRRLRGHVLARTYRVDDGVVLGPRRRRAHVDQLARDDLDPVCGTRLPARPRHGALRDGVRGHHAVLGAGLRAGRPGDRPRPRGVRRGRRAGRVGVGAGRTASVAEADPQTAAPHASGPAGTEHGRFSSVNTAERLSALCDSHPDRHVGGPGNRAANDLFAEEAEAAGFEVERIGFEALEWVPGPRARGSTRWRQAGRAARRPVLDAFDAICPLVCVASVDELEALDAPGAILLLHGEIAAEQLTPRRYPFYNMDAHKRILSALDRAWPAAVIAATDRTPMAAALCPFPLFEDGDLGHPSAFLHATDGERLLAHAGEHVRLRIDSLARAYPPSRSSRARAAQLRRPARGRERAHRQPLRHPWRARQRCRRLRAAGARGPSRRGSRRRSTSSSCPSTAKTTTRRPGEMAYLARRTSRSTDIALVINIDAVGRVGDDTAISFYGCPDEIRDAALAAAATVPEHRRGTRVADERPHGLRHARHARDRRHLERPARHRRNRRAHRRLDVPELVDPALVDGAAAFIAELIRRLADLGSHRAAQPLADGYQRHQTHTCREDPPWPAPADEPVPQLTPPEREALAPIYAERLEEHYGDPHAALHFADAYQLLIAVILSAQTTDVGVNKATPALFERFPTPADLAEADQLEVEEYVRTLGFYHQKAKNIIKTAQMHRRRVRRARCPTRWRG